MPLLPLYTAAIAISATLLFLVQPLFARLSLPLFGGSPQVWATCMVFFQVMLLAGYGYSHWLSRAMAFKRQVVLHAGVMLLPVLVLPIGIDAGAVAPPDSHPELWFLGILATSVGLPFFVVSTTGPLLQRWFSYTPHPDAHDPYFLYAASNIGSMLGLLGYPALVEPLLRLGDQSRLWTGGYVLLVLVTWAAAALGWRSIASGQAHPEAASDTPSEPLPLGRIARWIALAFVPSSLMLGLTTHITTDIAVFPLLWVIPLAAYLLTFTLVFARRQLIPHAWVVRALPILALVLAIVLVSETSEPTWLILAFHGGFFFVACMVCHGELAADRPQVSGLTTFYLMMAVGGALGGVFNALVSPLLFDAVMEYPITIILACLLCPPRSDAGHVRLRPADLIYVLLVGGTVLALPLVVDPMTETMGLAGPAFHPVRTALVIALPLVACFALASKPVRFGLALGGWYLAAAILYQQNRGEVLFADRSFFGVHRVLDHPGQQARMLRHGFTVHGLQKHDPALREMATAYYHPTGPAGQLFSAYGRDMTDIAVVGLGAGTLASYASQGTRMTYFEIDPVVIDIANNGDLFTYLHDARARGAAIDMRLGDARVALQDETEGGFDLIIIDAFTSDAIPIHLLTREALALYFSRLDEDGILLMHVSNKRLNVKRPLGDLAGDAGLVAWFQDNPIESQWEMDTGKFFSQWVVMARKESDLARLATSGRWRQLPPSGQDVWTDDYSNILALLLSR